jgi:dTDP-4-amino-4,6-dideoxygalactose transaminase
MPVHLYGQPANLDPILELAQRRGVLVVEDAAQAHGARYKGRRIGGHGDVVCWSFYPGKNLGALGDGGAITTNHPEIAERIKSLRNYGSSIKYVNEVQGYNSRLDPVQAAVLRVKLQYLDEWNSRRSAIASKYLAALQHSSLLLPHVPEWADPVWHLFVVQHARRDRLQETLKSRGVDTLIHYPIPPHRQKAYADLAIPPGSLPVAEAMAARVLSLPIGPQLNLQDVERTIQILGEATRE